MWSPSGRPSRTWVRLALLAVLATFAACKESGSATGQTGSGKAASRGGKKLYVVATTGMIGDLARRVAGPAAKVESLMASGVDPHLYRASAGDLRKLSRADVIFYNGLHLEGKMATVLHKMSRRRPVVAVAEAIPKAQRRTAPGFAGAYDPHVWFDVSLWARTIDPIRVSLAKLRPAAAAGLARRAKKLAGELATLDSWVHTELAKIPKAQRVLVTAHDAFGYFGRRYGIEVVGLQGISTVSKAGLTDVARVVKLITERKVKAIFVESSVPRRTIEAVKQACAARGHTVAIGGELFSDAMGAPGTPEGTYPGMVRHNVETIVKALK